MDLPDEHVLGIKMEAIRLVDPENLEPTPFESSDGETASNGSQQAEDMHGKQEGESEKNSRHVGQFLRLLKDKLTIFPLSVYFIFTTEISERYYFYGMRSLLSIYFVSPKVGLDEKTATLLYHTFNASAYISPLFGGYLADAVLGNYWTIMFLSLVYVFGASVVAISAFFGWLAQTLFGLMFVALGTGGIKPCVSTFGADQLSGEEKLMTTYFHVFYFCINAGSFCSVVLSPLIRIYTSFTVAFGMATLFLSLSLVIFSAGYPLYSAGKRRKSPLVEIAYIFLVATREKAKNPLNWKYLGLATPYVGKQRVSDVRALAKVLRFFLTLPVFWSLFDQQGSRWVFQGRRMVQELPFFSSVSIRPEQMMVLNSSFVLLMIPVFERIVYPVFRKMGIKVTALRRVFVGMIISMFAFIISGILEIFVELGYNVHILFQIPQYFLITFGELLCSITGLEHAYNMAPMSMKSAVMALYQLTVAFGNIVVALTAHISFSSILPISSMEGEENSASSPLDYFFFATLMFLCVIAFPFINMSIPGWRARKDEHEVALTQSADFDDQKTEDEDSDEGVDEMNDSISEIDSKESIN